MKRYCLSLIILGVVITGALMASCRTSGGSRAVQVEKPRFQATPLIPAVASQDCDKCQGYVLPGYLAPSPHSTYTIWSDLPENFCSNGVLYTTNLILPADSEQRPPVNMRAQLKAPDFSYIDDCFDVFLFHTIFHCKPPSPPRRIVIHVRNDGDEPVTLSPRQVIVTDGIIGTIHEMESTLCRRIMEEDWDTPVDPLTLAPGQGDVVAFSKRFGEKENTEDKSANQNCFGFARTQVKKQGEAPVRLTVSVVAIDAADADENRLRAEAVLHQGALFRDDAVDPATTPTGCQVRRATGVFRSFVWKNDPLAIDVSSLDSEGLSFLMAAWEIATRGCPQARQTTDLILHPPYTRPDSIGNYLVDYVLGIELFNPDLTSSHVVDLRFAKSDADIGLAWRLAVDSRPPSDEYLLAHPVHTGWAGPKQEGLSRSFLDAEGGPLVLQPGEHRHVALHFQIQGNSSLPFDLLIQPVKP